MAAPVLQQTTPLDNATGVAVTANLVLTFNQTIRLGSSGNIGIYKSDGTLVHTISISDESQVNLPNRSTTLTINPSIDLVPGTSYYVLMDAGTIENRNGDDFSGISSPTQFNFTTAGTVPVDTTAPTLSVTSPADNATNVLASTNLVLTFSEAVKAGTGNFEIRSTTYPGAPVLIPVTDTSQVSFSGNQVTINPTYDFAPGYTYFVIFNPNVVRDLANNASTGIGAPQLFNFTIAGVIDATQPQFVSSTPADETTIFNAHSNIVLTFDEAVKPGSGTIWVQGYGGGVFDVNDTSQVTFSGNQIIINPANDLIEGRHYYITTSLGAIRDLAENSFVGFSNEEDLDFTTADPTPPTLVSATAHDQLYYFTLAFSEPVDPGTGNIEFRNRLDGSLVQSFAITDESQVDFYGNGIQVTPSSPLPLGINYYVTIGSGVILDGAGNAFAGISSPTTFNFSSTPLDLVGTQGNDTLTGTSFNEVLNGVTGVDTLIGGLGDDTYIIDNYEGGATSFLFYAPPGWFGDIHVVDSLLPNIADVTYNLSDLTGDGIVDLLGIGNWPGTGTGFAALVVSTNEIDQNLVEGVTYTDVRKTGTPGHAGLDLITSGSWGTSTGPHYTNFTVNDLNIDYTDPDNPVLISLSITFDSRNGYPDSPIMYGTVNYNYAGAGPVTLDTIVEGPNAGIDTVEASMSYTLPVNFENLVLMGGADGIGNAADNIITARAVEADNFLDGKAGADTMIGGYGDDTYIVDNTGDQTIEDQDSLGGHDKVFSSVTFSLGIYVEELTLTGGANINGTGNSQGNTLTGNSGNNVMNGGAGDDWITGGGGNDSFVVKAGEGNDVIVDFSAGAGAGDVVALEGFSFANFAAVQAAMSSAGGDTTLNLGNGQTLMFSNVAKSSFAPNDFGFAVSNTPPVATIGNKSLSINEWSQVQSWISYSDANGNAATQYQFWDDGTASTSGFFWTPSNAHHPAGIGITVAAADLASVWVRGGQTAGSETMWVRAFDGTDWSAWDSFTFTTSANANTPPVATIGNKTLNINEWSQVQSWISYSDANGNAATQYQFWDDGTASTSGFFWTPTNAHHPANTSITVAAADLANVWVRGGQTAGSETMWVRAFDGTEWSAWDAWTLNTIV